MYKIVPTARAWSPVKWTGVDEEGHPVENSIELRFHVLKTDDALPIVRDASEVILGIDAAQPGTVAKSMAAVIMRMADNWRGVHAENDDPLPFEEAHVVALMSAAIPAFTAAVVAYRQILQGEGGRRAGN